MHGITAETAEHIWELAIRIYFEGDETTIEDKVVYVYRIIIGGTGYVK